MNRRLPQLLSILGLLALIVALAPRSVVAAQDLIGTTSHVSVSSGGVQGNAASDSPAISADGRYVAFSSQASNLVPGDTNDRWDVFVHDLQTGRTSLVSVSSNSEQGDDMSVRPAISADGRYVAFSSAASNLVAEDSNNSGDIFVRDMVTGETSLVSRHTNGEQGNFYSSFPSISSDGRYVSFSSYASNLVDDDVVMCWGRSCEDTFVHDRATGATVLVTRHSNGTPSNYEYYSHLSSLSADGRSVVFNSDASNLIDNDANGNYADIFIHDILTGKTALVSRSTNNVQGNRESLTSFISPNGRFIAFSSEASNLIDYHDNTGTDDVFIHDRETQETQLVSKASDGTQGDDDSWHPSLSGDGRFVVFLSTARNLAEEQISNCGQTVCQDVILHDRNTGETVKIGRSIDPVPENNHYRSARISSDSRYIVFVSDNSQLVEGDVNGASDVFLFDRVTSLISLVSRSSTGIGRDLRLDLLIEDSRDDVVVNKTAGSYVDIVAELTGPQLLAPDVTLHVPNDVLGAPVLTFTRDNADSSRGYGQENQYVNLGGGQYRVGTALTQMALDNQTLFHKEVVWRFQVPDSADLGDLTVTAVAEQAGMTFIFGADEASFRIVDRGNAILVTNRERLFAVYGQGEKWAEVDGLLSEIYRAATQRSGEVFYVDRYGVDWNPTTSETAANVVVQSIDSRIEQWYTQLRANDSSAPPRYLLLVGGDEIIPFWRADDDRYACSYQADACEDAHWASGNSTYGVLWNAYDDNYFLTDNVYADIGGAVADWEKGNLEMAVGRIAGRNAAQMRYLISNGYNRTRSLLAGGVASIEGVDVDRIVAAMDSRDVSTIGGSNPDLTENNGWTAAQFADV